MGSNNNNALVFKRRAMAGISIVALAASGVLAASPTAVAQTQWTGSTSSDWFNAANWTNGVPGPWNAFNTPPYDAIIDNGAAKPATVGGPGAQTGTLIVGNSATGRLNITAGGGLTVLGVPGPGVFPLSIGNLATGNGAVTVSGAGANLTSSSGIAVGRAGTGRLDVLNGASVNSSLGYVGADAGSQGTAVVDAATWTMGRLFVGNYGTGQFTLQNGGKATVTDNLGATAGNYANSTGTITVDGTGSTLDDQGFLASMTLGYNGAGHLIVSNQGTVTSLGTCIGCGTGGVGTALVTGTGSKWQLTDTGYEYVIGGSGTGTLTVSDNGLVQADGNGLIITVGSEATGRGTVHLTTGGKAQFDTLNLGGWTAGSAGSIGEAIVESGGQLSSKAGNVGGFAGALGKVTVTGAGSRWDHTSQLTLGYEGRGEMTVSAGGEVASQSAIIASNPGSTGTATVTGAGSKWTNAQHLFVGNRGIASLFVQNGGEVNTGSLSVGPGGQGAVEISGGGKLTTGTAMLGTNGTGGNAMSPTTGDVLVTGAGSSFVASTYIWAGSQGARGALTIADSGTVSINNGIYNPATFAGILYLGDDSVAGSAGTLNIGGATVAAAPGTLTAAGVAFNTLADTLNFNHTSANYDFAPSLLGNGVVNVKAGTTHLSGDSSLLGGFIGQLNVLGGKLYVDNKLGGGTDGAGPVAVASGALLGGIGTIAGAVTVADGGILEGRSGQVLTMGSLVLNPNSNVNVALGAPSASALFNVTGAFTLDGKLNATDAGGLSNGTYRLANYGGALTNNGLTVTSVPVGFNPGNWSVDTAAVGQVNLIIPAAGPNTQYWDGPNMAPGGIANGRSGTGTWNAANTNWTNQAGTINAPWAGQTAIFAPRSGSAATITIDGAQAITGMTFLPSATDPGYFYTAYRFNAGAGGKLTIANAATPFDVGGTPGVARADNIIAAPVEGVGGIRKLGDGILTLRGANSYSGGTAVDVGIMVADFSATALGTGPVTVGANGTLLFGAGPTGHLAISNAGQLFFDTFHSAVANYGGDATVTNTGRLVISNLTNGKDLAIINDGGLVEGSLIVGPGTKFVEATGRRGFVPAVGSISGSGTLRGSFDVGYLNRNDVFSGVMEDIPYGTEADGVTPSTQSALIKSGTGTLTLTGANTYTGGTRVQGGRLLVDGSVLKDVEVASTGTVGGIGSIGGQLTVLNNGALEGRAGQTLTMGGLMLNAGSQVNVALGAPGNATGLFKVNGNLVLDGTLNATDAGGFGNGVYRVIDYTGSLTDNGMNVGALPSGTGIVQTAIANQVNLVVSTAPAGATEFWNGTQTVADGTIHGGSGTWIAGPTNWTNAGGSVAGAWGSQFAIFQNNPGTVTVDNSAGAISTTGMQFIGAGWTMTGQALALNGAGGNTSIRVGDGSPAGASHSATIAAELTGASRLVKDDLGTLILTGANSYTGGTTVANGALQIGNGGASGSIAGDVLNNATLAFNRPDDHSFGGAITGNGTIRQIGGGMLTLTGNSGAFAGATSVEGGTLAVNGSLGGAVNVASGGTLTGSGMVGPVSVTNGGILSGVQGQTLTTGNLTLASGSSVNVALGAAGGAGLFKVNGNLVLGGMLNVTDAGGFGVGVYRVFDYMGSLTDNGMNTGTMPSLPAGATTTVQTAMANQVNLVVSGAPAGATEFWNGTQTVADGTIHGGSGTWIAGPTNWTNANGSTVGAWGGKFAIFQNTPGTVTVDNSAGAISTTGMQFIGSGWTVASQALTLNGAGGNTSIRVGDGSPAGASHNATIAAELTGASRLVKDDLGTLILTGANSYTGGTTVANGALKIGNGGISGSITGDVLNNAMLAFNRSDDHNFSGVITGNGAIRQIGSGKTELTGDSSGFAGATTVENGTLAVNGQLGGALDVLAGGRLQGVGTAGNTVVSGVIAPGNSIGTLSVGNILFNKGSIYEVEVNAAGGSDLIKASGTASITGGTVRVLAGAGSYAPATTYTILTAAGGLAANSAFDGATSNLAFLDPSLSYDATNVYLTMIRNGTAFRNVGITPNQIAAGDGVESLGLGSPVYNAVLNLSAPQAQRAFDQLSGEIHASARAMMLEDSRFIRNAVNDRIRSAFDSVGASNGYKDGRPRTEAASANGVTVWGQAFGAWGHWNGDGNAARFDRSIDGFFFGADAPIFDTWRFGAVAGYSRANFNVKDRLSSGSSENYHAGLYGGAAWGDLALRSGAAYSWHNISTSRSVGLPGIADSLRGDYNAGTAQIFGELAYGIRAGGFAFEPFANLAYVNLHTRAFTERGNAAALTSGSADTDTTFTMLGLRTSTNFNLGATAAILKGTFGWRHAFGDVMPNAAMRFAGGGDAFTIAGVPIARNAAVIEAGLDFAVSSAATLGVSYGGQFGSGVTDQSVRANFNMKF